MTITQLQFPGVRPTPIYHADWGIRLVRERQVNIRAVPTRKAIEESVDLAYEIFNRVFRKVPARSEEKWRAILRHIITLRPPK